MKTPYTTKSGLQIGRYYQRPNRVWPSRDMERLQVALLLREPPLVTPRRVLDAVPWAASVVVMIATFVLGTRAF